VRIIAAAILGVLFSVAIPATASESQPRNAAAVIERMQADNPSLSTYRARVHVAVHMLDFPYLSPQLDGTSYYRRPGAYVVVFDRVPFYMRGFSKLFDNMGDAGSWNRDENVTLLGTQQQAGETLLVLRMTKKVHSDVLDHTDAFIDAQTYRLVRMEWHYTNGGTIVMTQSYRMQQGFIVPALQHAYVDIPHVRAVGDAVYQDYQVNVPVSEAVFDKS
jgi:outer membrane lipoprotein-sorting protein